MKRIVQNLLAVFLLAVLLVPVTALGAEKCEHVMPDEAVWTWTPPATPGEGTASYTITAECTKCGKKKMRQLGSVSLPSEAFTAVLKLDSDDD